MQTKEEISDYQRRWYLKNKKRILAQRKIYYKTNIKKIKRFNTKNREVILSCKRKSYQKHREKILAKAKQYRLNNLEKLKAYDKTFYLKNKKRKIHQKVAYMRERRKNDAAFRFKMNFSASIAKALKRFGSRKNGQSCFKFLPYTKEDLRRHLEKQFEPWMNWNNYGPYKIRSWNDNDITTWTWCVDHIIPQSKLPYKSMKDKNFQKMWALKNLRPYSSKQNLLDGNRRKIKPV